MNLKPTHPDDLPLLAATLRACDLKEIELGTASLPLEAVTTACGYSDFTQSIWTEAGLLAGSGGVAARQPGVGSIWMLGSPELESIPLSFLRACRPAIARAHALYPTLACAAWRENALHLNWLRWLGFTQNDVGHPHFIPHYRHV